MQGAGSRPEPRLLLLPRSVPHAANRPVRVLGVLADGNARSGQQYEAGAANIMRVARRVLGRPGGPSTLVVFILSADNLARRSEAFLDAIYKAFFKTALRFCMEPSLGRAGIEWGYVGDLEGMRARSAGASRLVDLMELTGRLNNEALPDGAPRRRLLLGVNYGPGAAAEVGLDLLYRSGMEAPGLARFGSLRLGADLLLAADDVLWPAVQPARFDALLDAAAGHPRSRSAGPYTAAELAPALGELLGRELVGPWTLVVPCADPVQVAGVLGQGPLRGSLGAAARDGDAVELPLGPGAAGCVLRLVPGAAAAGERVDLVIAPVPAGELLQLPSQHPVGYANIVPVRESAQGIADGVLRAARFFERYEPLRGAERQTLPGEDMLGVDAPGAVWGRALSSPSSPSELGDSELVARAREYLVGAGAPPSDAALYDAVGDAFLERMAAWTAAAGIPAQTEEQQRSIVNYCLTCFFMNYYPHHPRWPSIGPGWADAADWLSRMMLMVFYADEAVFDAVFPGDTPALRAARRHAAAAHLGAVLLDDAEPSAPDVPALAPLGAPLTSLAGLHRGFAEHVAPRTHPALLANWSRAMAHCYHCMACEGDPAAADNALVARLREEPAAAGELEARYWSGLPDFLAERGRAAVAGFLGGAGLARERAFQRVALLAHLCDHAGSIGSEAAFATEALSALPSIDVQSAVARLRALGVLSDFHIRIRNDLSSALTGHEADEGKTDALAVMQRWDPRDLDPLERTVRCAAELAGFAEEILAEEMRQLAPFREAWPRVELAFHRTSIAYDIYARAHYRTFPRDAMGALMHERRDVGIPALPAVQAAV